MPKRIFKVRLRKSVEQTSLPCQGMLSMKQAHMAQWHLTPFIFVLTKVHTTHTHTHTHTYSHAKMRFVFLQKVKFYTHPSMVLKLCSSGTLSASSLPFNLQGTPFINWGTNKAFCACLAVVSHLLGKEQRKRDLRTNTGSAEDSLEGKRMLLSQVWIRNSVFE